VSVSCSPSLRWVRQALDRHVFHDSCDYRGSLSGPVLWRRPRHPRAIVARDPGADDAPAVGLSAGLRR
jgi:hypothetical protein